MVLTIAYANNILYLDVFIRPTQVSDDDDD